MIVWGRACLIQMLGFDGLAAHTDAHAEPLSAL
jgi:hypothetical protein